MQGEADPPPAPALQDDAVAGPPLPAEAAAGGAAPPPHLAPRGASSMMPPPPLSSRKEKAAARVEGENRSEATQPQTPPEVEARPWPLFIRELCKSMEMRNVTTSTAQVYWHRFNARNGRERNNPYIVALACAFLAGKVEDDVQPLESVIQRGQRLRNLPALDAEQTWKTREKVIYCERAILGAMDFHVDVEHPHMHAAEMVSGDTLQIAKSFLNDSLTTGSALLFAPRLAAAAAVSLAMRFKKERQVLAEGKTFYGYTDAELAPVEVELLKIYEQEDKKDESGAKKRVKV